MAKLISGKNTPVELGNRIKDMVSGFEGICTADVKYLNGCEKWGIDGKVVNGSVECIWVDKVQVEKVNDGITSKIEAKQTGGPQRTPPRA